MNKLASYNKFLIAVLGAVVSVVYQQYGSNHWVSAVVAALTALGVYVAPNKV